MRRLATTTALALISLATLQFSAASASDLVWEVQSPFRFFKKAAAFNMHEKAYEAVRGKADSPLPANMVWRTERRLNDPDCADKSTPARCLATARKGFERSRLGWAAQTLDMVCYERNSRPFRYPTVCERQYSWGTAKEDYVLPEAHTVEVKLSAERATEAAAGECSWSFQPRGGKGESAKQPCKNTYVIKRVPYSPDAKVSGGEVKVKLPDGRELAEPIAVQDVLVVAMGDSFMSGESNPDRPVTFSAAREMVYDPSMANDRDQLAARKPANASTFGLASTDDQFDAKTLPRRRMEDEDKGLQFRASSQEFLAAFNKGGAQWLSADCHRSQYGYPFRVGIQMTLENRHRAVTLLSVACSGAETLGFFMNHDARERASEKGGAQVPPQLDQVADLLCRGGSQGRTQAASYTLPSYKHGSTGISAQTISKQWCPPANRKRPIDLVLLSIGGNDVGFGALAMYASTESARDLAPIAGLVGSEIRFGPDVSRAYLGALDKRIKAVRDALVDGFGVAPERVLQNAYEPIQYDETGSYCGNQATLGMDVHPSLKVSKARLGEVATIAAELEKRLACIAFNRRQARLPGRACDRQRHRLPLHHRAHRGVHEARDLRARSDPRAGRSGRDEDAAPLQGERRLRALFAVRRAPVRAPLAADPQSERRVPHREYPSRGHLAVRYPPAGLRGALLGRVPPDRGRPRDRRRSRDAPRAQRPRQGEEAGGRGAAELGSIFSLPRLRGRVGWGPYSRTILATGSLRFSPTKNATGSATLSIRHSN